MLYRAKRRKAKDSVATLGNINTPFNKGAKEIEIKGIKTIGSDRISIYNEEGIKAKGFFDSADKKIVYTYELAVPLKYLNNVQSFRYNIKLNEPRKLVMNGPPTGPPPPPMMTTSIATTDFSGEYTLAK